MENVQKIKGVLLNIENDEAKVVEFEPRLQQYYDLLHCDCIGVVPRTLGYNRSHRRFDIVCDEEGTYKEDNKISAIDNLGRVMFVGSLLVVNRAENGQYSLF